MPQADSSTKSDPLGHFQAPLRQWFAEAFVAPTSAQTKAWPIIAKGHHTLLLAPTGSGKTLAAFLVAIDRIMFGRDAGELPPKENDDKRRRGVKVLYISPLKALAVDIERNLRSPLVGVTAVAERTGTPHHVPTVGVRSGDTSTRDRYRLNRQPPDILITTPESLYLMLTSRARENLATSDTVIVDEIHSVASTKRGTHLFLSLERLENLRDPRHGPLQRIGLSATQRPLAEIARLLGGALLGENSEQPLRPRRVEIVEAGRRKQLELNIEVPVEDMTRLGDAGLDNDDVAKPTPPSIWPAIHPRLVALIREHRSTMVFVNSRRLAERLSAAINELAGTELALAHHGSIAKDTRLRIEDRLKRGELPAIVATSSMELGIDMGAVDLVIQIESPPSIASGIQRIGRGGHQVGAPSKGIVFPKYRGDLLACSAAAERMVNGKVEETFYPRNPLDVLAQQIVAMVALEPVSVDELYGTARRAAPFHELPRSALESVLDLLSGRYPSDEFSELRPRVTWDRVGGMVAPRRGTQRLAIVNAGTIPDRGLYGVFLADGAGGRSRVGELDEEMVFETHPGDVFLLGASSWRVLDITNDRVIVAPAPGEPGRMPFWRGDGPGRPREFGQAIGELTRRLLRMSRDDAEQQLSTQHSLDRRAAFNLMNYLHDQSESTGEVPTDRTIVVESFLDEVGDWRVALLSPFGARVHIPWAMAVAAKLRRETNGDVDQMWTDDGIMYRIPETPEPPPVEWFFPAADEIEGMVTRELSGTALFAARFRENAARALLLPRRQPGRRTPLWLQRRRAADLLAVAAHYPDFPMLLETYRECLRDVFDLRGLKQILRDVERRAIRVRGVRTAVASPFASTLMFNYVGGFIYDGDAPLAERRAAALTLDHAQLRELLGDAELRDLLDADAVEELALELQRLDDKYRLRHEDDVHELLLYFGDLACDEIALRCQSDAVRSGQLDSWLASLVSSRRVVELRIGGDARYIAAEDAARYRDALGAALPAGLPSAFLASVDDPLGDLVSRFARTHTPFSASDPAARWAMGIAPVQAALQRLIGQDRIVEGELLPGRRGREYCDANVLRRLKRRSLARLRKQIEPVDQEALVRFLPLWHGLDQPHRGLDGLLDAIEQIQGVALPAATLQRDVLTSRVANFQPSDLDELCAAGEVIWRGCGGSSAGDGRIALYLTDHYQLLAPYFNEIEDDAAAAIRVLLSQRGALFFKDIAASIGGFRNDVLDVLWDMVWAGELTNDTLAPLRSSRRETQRPRGKGRRAGRRFRSRRTTRLPGSAGRWSLLDAARPSSTERQAALAAQLIERHGVLTREVIVAEGSPGGFSAVYPVLKAMEEAGRVRRGYFVAGLGAAQFAAPGAEERLRQCKDAERDRTETLVLAATDPANPYGMALKWPEVSDEASRPGRNAGARVILHQGTLVGYLNRTGEHLVTFLPSDEPDRSRRAEVLVQTLTRLAIPGQPVYLTKVDGAAPANSVLGEALQVAGFTATPRGFQYRDST